MPAHPDVGRPSAHVLQYLLVAVAAVTAPAACSHDTGTTPSPTPVADCRSLAPDGVSQAGDLRMTGEVVPSTSGAGNPVTLTFRLQNAGPDPVDIEFSQGCRLLPCIRNCTTGSWVEPQDGVWGCTQSISHLTLQAGGTLDDSQTMFMSAGTYVAWAGLVPAWVGSTLLRMRSDPLVFSVTN